MTPNQLLHDLIHDPALRASKDEHDLGALLDEWHDTRWLSLNKAARAKRLARRVAHRHGLDVDAVYEYYDSGTT